MQSFSSDHKFLAVLTTEDKVLQNEGDPKPLTADQVAEYLGKSTLNAVILVGSDDDIFGAQTFNPPVFVARNADEATYYAAQHPTLDPDDVYVEGVDVETALRESTIEYYE